MSALLLCGSALADNGVSAPKSYAISSDPAPPSYIVVWSIAANHLSVNIGQPGATTTSKLTLRNPGSVPAHAQLRVNIPAGFKTSDRTPSCGGRFEEVDGKLEILGATIPPEAQCEFKFHLTTPALRDLPRQKPVFDLTAARGPGLAIMTSQTNPSLAILGFTPGTYAWWSFPQKTPGLLVLDAYVTPTTDPGPSSNIYWAEQIDALGGYTGIQSTMLTGAEGTGRLFLFSLWGAINYKTGTPASAGIGGGSFCTMSATATDGSAGVQCRYRYQWRPGHTYRFRVTPQPSLGSGWFKSNVTDVTGGMEGDSFDIGMIEVDTNLPKYAAAANSIPANLAIGTWTEYFEWNSAHTTPLSVPYSKAVFSVTATDVNGAAVTPNKVSTSESGGDKTISSSVLDGDNAVETNGIGQSVRGLFKAGGLCLSAKNGSSEGTPEGSNSVSLTACPTLEKVVAKGPKEFSNAFWVLAADDSIELPYSYCLTSPDPAGASGGIVNVRSCDGSEAQKWNVVTAGNGAHALKSKTAGLCVTPAMQPSLDGSVALSLGSCTGATGIWTVPGLTFHY